jgi:hypothetical protein
MSVRVVFKDPAVGTFAYVSAGTVGKALMAANDDGGMENMTRLAAAGGLGFAVLGGRAGAAATLHAHSVPVYVRTHSLPDCVFVVYQCT